jgi:hypothetical protein
MSKFEHRGYVVAIQHGLNVHMATAADLTTGRALPQVVTATAAEGVEVLMRRARLAIDDAVRANPAADLWAGAAAGRYASPASDTHGPAEF